VMGIEFHQIGIFKQLKTVEFVVGALMATASKAHGKNLASSSGAN
jgi:hypothetical protein